jgi:mono/diheme cytochrome c family protein
VTLSIVVGFAVVTVLILGVRGFRSPRPPLQPFSDMVDQPRYRPQSASAFFADGRAQRLPPVGAVAWGRDAREPDAAFLPRDDEYFGLAEIPVRVDRALLLEGQRLYNVYCRVCHGATGAGNGITTQYGMINPPAYHSQRLLDLTAGEIYKTITLGKGQMGPYGDRIRPADRWAIVAYVRALQRAHTATLEDVPPAQRQQLETERNGS